MIRGVNHCLIALSKTLPVRFATSVCIAFLLSMFLSAPTAADAIRWRSAIDTEGVVPSSASRDPVRLQAAINDLAARTADPSATDATRHVCVQFDRPIDANTRVRLRSAGIELLTYLGDNAFFATLSLDRLNAHAIANTASLVDTRAIRREWKVHPSFSIGEIPIWAIVPNASTQANALNNRSATVGATQADDEPIHVAAYVLFHPDVPVHPDAADICHRHNARIRSQLQSINVMVIELPLSEINALADEDAVQWIEPPLPRMSEINNSARNLAQAEIVQNTPYGLQGYGVNVLVYDGGTAYADHVDFGGRLTVRDSSGLSYHATHVAGIIGGDGSVSDGLYRGMAPGVQLQSYGFEYDGAGMFLYTNPGDIESDYDEAINFYGAQIANNSIGTNIAYNGFPCQWEGDYGITSMLIDAIVTGSLGEPMRIIWANGNERGYTRCGQSYLSTAPPACAKNHIAVGAVNSNDDSIAWFSSWGPTDDGRLKPDVCAPGCQSNDDRGLTSTSTSGEYLTLCGTSMACPVVTGVSALLLQDWRNLWLRSPLPRNATLKTLLIHTAKDLGTVGPDYQSGFGSVRIRDAIDFMRGQSFREDSLEQGDVKTYSVQVPPGTTSLKATIAWDDPPGAPNTVPELVNDLDLLAIGPAGQVIAYPWTLDADDPEAPAVRNQPDRVNNVEQVVVDDPAPGTWIIQVRGYLVPIGPQVFAIATSPAMTACSSAGAITLNTEQYPCASTAVVTVNDCDLDTDPSMIETVTIHVNSTSEPAGENIILTATSYQSAIFVGTVELTEADTPGQLQVTHGDSITALYVDDNDGTGRALDVESSAMIDCVEPAISNVTIDDVTARSAMITFDTNELAKVTVQFGLACDELTQTLSASGYKTSHTLTLTGLQPDQAYFLTVEAEDSAGNLSIDDNAGSCFTFMTPDAPDYFTQRFFGGRIDLANKSMTLAPHGSIDFYAACLEPITELPVDPSGGTWLQNITEVQLPAGVSVSLYGVSYDRFFVNTDGSISFKNWSDTNKNVYDRHFYVPHISTLMDWYYPAEDGRISWKQLSDRIAATWEHVTDASTGLANTFQVEMFFDGRIRMSWLDVTTLDPLVGLSTGQGMPTDFAESDLSEYQRCVTDDLAVAPGGGFVSRGYQGGPFVPSCNSLTLTNMSDPPTPMTWSAQATVSWLTVTPTDGIVVAGTPATVEVCINASAQDLPAGEAVYIGSVLFTNTSSGIAQTRDIQLTVLAHSAPIASDVLTATSSGMPIEIELVASDDGDPDPPAALSYIVAAGPSHGNLSSDDGDAIIIYTPDPDFIGVDYFVFKADDGGTPPVGGDSNEATVTIRVLPSSSAPINPYPPDTATGVPTDTAYLSFQAENPSLLRVAIVAAAHPYGITDPFFTDPRAKLMGTGRFNDVALIDAGAMTPRLCDLKAFDGIIVWSNDQFDDPFTLGDRLADYVDSGGGVVLAVFANVSLRSFGNVWGRFLSDNYFCIDYPSDTRTGALLDGPQRTLGNVFMPGHPLMSGITTFSGGYRSFRPRSSYLAPAAELIANWNGGAPLIAVREINGTPRVDLGMFPTSDDVSHGFWDADTDGDQILGNALAYVCKGSGALTTYDVYFGTDNPPATCICRDALDSACPIPYPLSYATTYYWQIVAHNLAGSVPGGLWSFTTPAMSDMQLRDTVADPLDANIPFGEVALGTARREQVTVCNAGTTNELLITDISIQPLPLYAEDFEDGHAQAFLPTEPADWQVVSGAYKAASDEPSANMQAIYSADSWQDCSVHLTARRIGSLYTSAGVAIRASDDFNWSNGTGSAYIVGISASGQFYVGAYVDGEFTFVQDWSRSSTLKQLTAINELTVNIFGSDIDVYFNGILAWTGNDSQIPQAGRIALLGYSDVNSRITEHIFDDIQVGIPLLRASGLAAGLAAYANGMQNTFTVGSPEMAPEDEGVVFATGESTFLVSKIGDAIPDPCSGFHLENMPALPIVLAPDACFSTDVVFAPVVEGLQACGIVIQGSAVAGSEQVVSLTGTGGPGYLAVTPTDGFTSNGPQGGPFAPDCIGYTLTNIGLSDVNWTATASEPWLDITPTAGTLAGQTQVTVNVCINALADDLLPSTHTATLTFSDTGAGLSHTRDVELIICMLPSMPINPEPANDASDVSFSAPLAWNVGVPIDQTCYASGQAAISYISWDQVLANVYTVEQRQSLHGIKVKLDIAGSVDLHYLVCESPERQGPFVPIVQKIVPTVGVGESSYSSGLVYFTLEPGMYYAIGVAWGDDDIGFGLDYQSHPIDWEFGTIEGSVDEYVSPPVAEPLTNFSAGVSVPVELCLDDAGGLTYDVYFGEQGSALTRVCEDLAAPVCALPDSLEPGAVYDWQVLAHSACGSRLSDLWSFATASCSSNPPIIDRNEGNHPVSRKTHGSAGTFDVDLIAPAERCSLAVECRTGGMTQLVVKFDRPIAGRDGLDPSDVEIVGGSTGNHPVNNIWIDVDRLTIELLALPDDRYTLSFPGIGEAGAATCSVTDTLSFAVLAGDVDANGRVNLFDLLRIRDNMIQPMTVINFRSDTNADGLIDLFDLDAVRDHLDSTVPVVCP